MQGIRARTRALRKLVVGELEKDSRKVDSDLNGLFRCFRAQQRKKLGDNDAGNRLLKRGGLVLRGLLPLLFRLISAPRRHRDDWDIKVRAELQVVVRADGVRRGFLADERREIEPLHLFFKS